jgi:hypothetical protein
MNALWLYLLIVCISQWAVAASQPLCVNPSQTATVDTAPLWYTNTSVALLNATTYCSALNCSRDHVCSPDLSRCVCHPSRIPLYDGAICFSPNDGPTSIFVDTTAEPPWYGYELTSTVSSVTTPMASAATWCVTHALVSRNATYTLTTTKLCAFTDKGVRLVKSNGPNVDMWCTAPWTGVNCTTPTKAGRFVPISGASSEPKYARLSDIPATTSAAPFQYAGVDFTSLGQTVTASGAGFNWYISLNADVMINTSVLASSCRTPIGTVACERFSDVFSAIAWKVDSPGVVTMTRTAPSTGCTPTPVRTIRVTFVCSPTQRNATVNSNDNCTARVTIPTPLACNVPINAPAVSTTPSYPAQPTPLSATRPFFYMGVDFKDLDISLPSLANSRLVVSLSSNAASGCGAGAAACSCLLSSPFTCTTLWTTDSGFAWSSLAHELSGVRTATGATLKRTSPASNCSAGQRTFALSFACYGDATTRGLASLSSPTDCAFDAVVYSPAACLVRPDAQPQSLPSTATVGNFLPAPNVGTSCVDSMMYDQTRNDYERRLPSVVCPQLGCDDATQACPTSGTTCICRASHVLMPSATGVWSCRHYTEVLRADEYVFTDPRGVTITPTPNGYHLNGILRWRYNSSHVAYHVALVKTDNVNKHFMYSSFMPLAIGETTSMFEVLPSGITEKGTLYVDATVLPNCDFERYPLEAAALPESAGVVAVQWLRPSVWCPAASCDDATQTCDQASVCQCRASLLRTENGCEQPSVVATRDQFGWETRGQYPYGTIMDEPINPYVAHWRVTSGSSYYIYGVLYDEVAQTLQTAGRLIDAVGSVGSGGTISLDLSVPIAKVFLL